MQLHWRYVENMMRKVSLRGNVSVHPAYTWLAPTQLEF